MIHASRSKPTIFRREFCHMQFQKTNSWFSIVLDTQRQMFVATDKLHPELFAEGVTIEDAVANLKTQA
jgi:hypothetical protein|nr:putative uncharacterized protein lp_0865 [Lactiplantibacillus pentosus MP-10]CCC16326.1 putative uncharacterized protein lp_0865 [Lactiplantibacillus pentosus IG1]